MGDSLFYNINSELIKITHFVNPHHFYFKYDKGTLDDRQVKLEFQIQVHCLQWLKRRDEAGEFAPKIGDTVAMLYRPWNKYIRVLVDTIIDFVHCDKRYILWAIDLGYV